MANIKQQKKRVGTASRQRLENLRYRSTVKTLAKRLDGASVTKHRFGETSFGARGSSKHWFYFQDPDGNVIEARHYDGGPV